MMNKALKSDVTAHVSSSPPHVLSRGSGQTPERCLARSLGDGSWKKYATTDAHAKRENRFFPSDGGLKGRGNKNSIDTLPDDLVLTILEYLDPDQILQSFGSLNHRCYRLARHEDLWENRLPAIHAFIDLLDAQSYVIAERRSKGRVQLAQLKGTGKKFVIRTVSLETTNAGKDDGVPTSCLRETSLLLGLDHPHVVKCFGATVRGTELKIVSEYIGPSLLTHLTQTPGTPCPEAHVIRSIMRQVLQGVDCIHKRGIIHRNIKSDNIVMGPGRSPSEPYHVKICDLAMGRCVDIPLGMYTPEDPKERDRSYREQRRLYNRAPEVILRQPVYGLEVDIWSVGCVFLETALGIPPFRCESEIGLLMSTLQLCGTPDVVLWDRISSASRCFLKLPVWDPIDMRAVAAVLSDTNLRSQGVDAAPLQIYKTQKDAVKTLLHFGDIVGSAGLHLLERLLVLPGCFRVSAEEALTFPYFTSKNPDSDPVVLAWISSWHEEAKAEHQPTPSEGAQAALLRPRLNSYYSRFLKLSKASLATFSALHGSSKNDSACWKLLQTMANRCARLPLEFGRLASMRFDYSEELERLRPVASNGGGAQQPITLLAAESGSSEALTPAPCRARYQARRRQETTDDSSVCQQLESPDDVSMHTEFVNPGYSDAELHGLEDIEFEVVHDIYIRTKYRKTLSQGFDRRQFSSDSLEVATDDDDMNVCSAGNSDSGRTQQTQLLNIQQSFADTWILRNSCTSQFLRRFHPPLLPVVCLSKCCPEALLPRVSPRTRLDIVNYILGIRPEFMLKSQTVHLAIGYFDRYTSFQQGYPSRITALNYITVALACLKIAEYVLWQKWQPLRVSSLYNEVSKEYYKQDNIQEYAEFSATPPPALFEDLRDAEGVKLSQAVTTPEELLHEEKAILNALRFDVLIPTVCWFVDAYLSVAKLLHLTHLVDYCHYLSDLGLHSHQLIVFTPPLQAQVVLLLACVALFRPTRHKVHVMQERGSVIKTVDPEYPKLLWHLLRHFVSHRNSLCATNSVWEVLDCIGLYRDLLLNGRRYFDAIGIRNVERVHPWVGRLAIPTPSIPPRLIKCILPSSQDEILKSFS